MNSFRTSLLRARYQLVAMVQALGRWVKFALFATYGWLCGILLIASFCVALSAEKGDRLKWAAVPAAGILGLTFTIQQRRLDEQKFFRELFLDFNKRFEALAAKLPKRDDAAAGALMDVAAVRAYCDLCAEEFFLYQAGYIRSDVWFEWCDGIMQFVEERGLTTFVSGELKLKKAYYGLTWTGVERGAKRAMQAREFAARARDEE